MAEYIDRKAFMQSMYHEAFEKDSDLQRWDGGCWIRYKMLENVIAATPAADVRIVVHGHWIDLRDCSNSGTYCSNCNNKIFDRPGPHKKKLLNFCPNCGADMRGAV